MGRGRDGEIDRERERWADIHIDIREGAAIDGPKT